MQQERSDVASGGSGSSTTILVDDKSCVYSSPSPNEGVHAGEFLEDTNKDEVETMNEDEVENTNEDEVENTNEVKVGGTTEVEVQDTNEVEVQDTNEVEVQDTNEDEIGETPEQVEKNKADDAVPATIDQATRSHAQGSTVCGGKTIILFCKEPTEREDESRSFGSTLRSPSPTCSYRSDSHASSTISTSTDNSRGSVVGHDKIRCIDQTGRNAFGSIRSKHRERPIQCKFERSDKGR
jgi:hypothetical protein